MGLHLLLIGVFAFTAPICFADSKVNSKSNSNEKYENLELFQKVIHFIETNYVEEVKSKDLIHGAIKGMLDTLDPHSNFLTAEIFKEMKSDTSGKFSGIGIEVGMKEGVPTVVAPMEDTPAWRAGILPGDKITRIDGESVKESNLSEVISKMRGSKGSTIRLTIMRDGFEKPKEFKLVREDIKIKTVRSEFLEPGIGYIKLATFNEDAASDVKQALESLKKGKKIKGLVFDLRMNPGGLLEQAIDVTSLFIDEGIVVSTIGRDVNQKEVRKVKKGTVYKDFPLAVLVNAGSASASEIVAGALQDNKRALILGQTTFGKGSVQTVVELGNDMGLKLTIARYYTPNGTSIQEKGVKPDIILEDYDPHLLEKAKRAQVRTREKDLKRHMTNPDKDEDAAKKDDDGAKFNPKEDYQVKQALNYLKSLEFYDRSGKPQVKDGV